MYLQKIELKNFRCFRSEVIEFDRYNPLVGANNSGKSTILRAIDVFFNATPKSSSITMDDFYGQKADQPLELRLTFSELTKAECDDFDHYSRGGQLKFVLRCTASQSGTISTEILGIRRGIQHLEIYFEASTAKEKREVVEVLKKQGIHLPDWKNEEEMTKAVREYEASNPDAWVDLESSEKAYGAVGPVPKLRRYLDWIFIPPVKDASDEASESRNSAFSKLILRAIRNKTQLTEKLDSLQTNFRESITSLLQEESGSLTTLEHELNTSFRLLTSSDIDVRLNWDTRKDVIGLSQPQVRSLFRDGDIESGPEYFGHGIQRTYILALLPLVAKYSGTTDDGQKLILGIEEPELYQHPPQARFLSNALMLLASNNTQVILTTHSPHFVNARKFNEIVSVRKPKAHTSIHRWTIDEHRSYYAKILGQKSIGMEAAKSGLDRLLRPSTSEIFFCAKAIIVEGQEDVAIISTYLKHRGKWEEFLRRGSHFILANGKPGIPQLI